MRPFTISTRSISSAGQMMIRERMTSTATVFTRIDGTCSLLMARCQLDGVGLEACPGETLFSSSEATLRRATNIIVIYMSTL